MSWNISTAAGNNSFLAQFNTTSSSSLSYNFNVNDTSVALTFMLYSMDNCSQIESFNCSADSYPCFYNTNSTLNSGSYYLFVTASSNSTNYYNLTMSWSSNNLTSSSSMGCMNISSQLTTCAAYLSPDDFYSIQTSVADYEAAATQAYNYLAGLWPSSCNDTLWSYACQGAFQPSLCNSTGNSSSWDNDCLSNLTDHCLNGSAPNLCQKNSCVTVTTIVCSRYPCNQTVTAPPSPQPSPSPSQPSPYQQPPSQQPSTYPNQPSTYPNQPSPSQPSPSQQPPSQQPGTYPMQPNWQQPPSQQPSTYPSQPSTYPSQPSTQQPASQQPSTYPMQPNWQQPSSQQPSTYPSQPTYQQPPTQQPSTYQQPPTQQPSTYSQPPTQQPPTYRQPPAQPQQVVHESEPCEEEVKKPSSRVEY